MGRNKLILIEEEKKEVDVMPAAELKQEPLPLMPEFNPEVKPEEVVVPEEIKVNAFSGLVNASISREWENIDALNSAISTFTSERPEDLSSIEILKQLVEEKTAHIGMLQKVLGIVDGKTYELVKDGEEKAEEIASEVVPEVGKEPKLEESKKPLKEDMTDDYWSAVVEGEVDFLVQDEMIGLLNNEEAEGILLNLGEDDIKKMSLEVGHYILSNEYVWERIMEVIREGIIHWIQKHITNPDNLKAEITPTEESLKKPLKENIDSDIVGQVGQGKDFNSNGFWNFEALKALERIIDDYNSGYYEDEENGVPDYVELIKTLTKEEIINICKRVSRDMDSLNDDCYDSLAQDAMDNMIMVLTKELENPKRLTAEITPGDK
jgi:bacterioferritin (cytochrome b1)